MKYIFAIILFLIPTISFAQALDLAGYQEAKGAVTTLYSGDKVDPYFATKAMLILLDTDAKEARPAAMAWAAWGINMQHTSGLFDRYKRSSTGRWVPYAQADADDAILALWMEMLYRLTPTEGMSANWQHSIDIADSQLARLYDPVTGTYHVSVDLPVSLLMDNIEIYSAFIHIAHEEYRLNHPDDAIKTLEKAALLAENIRKTFKPEDSDAYLISTQQPNKNLFYPDQVAQIYPLLYGLPNITSSRVVYKNWITTYGREWLSQKDNDFAWGLVAIAALKNGDNYSASCWQNRVEPFRYSSHWNVMEDAALQYVKRQLAERHYDHNLACVGGNLS